MSLAGRPWTRRRILGRLPAACAAGLLDIPRSAAARRSGVDAGPLRAAAVAGRLVFGAAGGSALFGDEAYRDLFLAQAALLTPENALKFDGLQPERGRFFFADADRLVDWARTQGLSVHGHTLIWNDRLPPWLSGLSRREVARSFDAYLDRVVPHFAGRIASWDVVNEPFYLGGDHPGTYRPGPWLDALGPGYVVRAFRRAAELDPSAKLVLNEAWTERADAIGLAVRRSLLRLVDELQHAGVRLDAVGLQSHLFPGIAYDDGGFTDFLHGLAERGVTIRLSEFDVDDESFPDADRDGLVARRAGAYLRAALSVEAVDTVVSWGLADRYSWWRDPSVMAAHGMTRLPRPLPFDEMLRRKPMADAMVAAVRCRGRNG